MSEIQKLQFPNVPNMTTDDDGNPATIDRVPGKSAGTPLKKLFFDPILKKISELVAASNEAVKNLQGYLPLTGGTLTGVLEGTTAAFSGLITAKNPSDVPGKVTGNNVATTYWTDSNFEQKGAVEGFKVGDIKPCYSNAVEPNWLVLNSGSFDGNKYPALRDFLGSTQLDDFRGMVLKGAGAGLDVRQFEGDAIRNIFGHVFEVMVNNYGVPVFEGSGAFHVDEKGNHTQFALPQNPNGNQWSSPIIFDASHCTPTAPEVRVKSKAVFWVIYAGKPAF